MTDIFTLEGLYRGLEILSIVGSAVFVAFNLIRNGQTVRDGMEQQAKYLKDVQDELKELRKIVTDVAVQKSRLDAQDQRLNEHGRMMEDLRRGEGFIFPLERSLYRKT